MIFTADIYEPCQHKNTRSGIHGRQLTLINGVAGTVKTAAKKSLAKPFPPVAEAEYGP